MKELLLRRMDNINARFQAAIVTAQRELAAAGDWSFDHTQGFMEIRAEYVEAENAYLKLMESRQSPPIPSDIYPLPEVLEGFTGWKYQGIDWRCDDGPPVTFANCAQRVVGEVQWDIHKDTYPEGMGHYLQAV